MMPQPNRLVLEVGIYNRRPSVVFIVTHRKENPLLMGLKVQDLQDKLENMEEGY